MPVSPDYVTSREYEERVYAGVLGKIIGVYLGRPFEGWSNKDIESKLGEVDYYVHEKLNAPLIVTDDDISGTFTFLRALPANGNDPDLTPGQIGDWWLNTIIENRTILWWGGMGRSTEDTAFRRLQKGIKAPESGSIGLNGRTVAEQIGSQIFIDGWGLINPGDPERAADFARRAASVSHDGEGIYGAQVIAALEAQAFVETDLGKMLDVAQTLIPQDSVISRVITDMRAWARDNGDDWRATMRQLQANYGYDKYGGGCHMVPNHAVILLGLLHGKNDFQRSLMIANTAGYDTDCNSGNVGCFLGVRNGLAGIDSSPVDWRGPVADRLFLPTADGGRAISDALRESYEVVNIARALTGQLPTAPKDGARFHFSLPGSVQGFGAQEEAISLGNEGGKLALRLNHLAVGQVARTATATFTPPSELNMGGYSLIASPTLYSGQTITACVEAASNLSGLVEITLSLGVYNKDGALTYQRGPAQTLSRETAATLEWTVPDTDGQPIAEVGIEVTAKKSVVTGTVRLDALTWRGTPNVTLKRPEEGGSVWERAWANGADHFHGEWSSPGMSYLLVHDDGPGLVSQGEGAWSDYTVSTEVLPHLADRVGLLAGFQGIRRYVALLLDRDHRVKLIVQRDGEQQVLAESDQTWAYETRLTLELTVRGGEVTARAGEATLMAQTDAAFTSGAVGLLVDTGHAEFTAVRVKPV